MISRLGAIPKTYPFAFGVVFSTAKTSFSDLLVQKFVEKRKEVDWRRNAAFATFGCFYLGMAQYVVYVPVFTRLFPTAASFPGKTIAGKLKDFRGQLEALGQVAADQLVHHPFMYFPAFYCVKELVVKGPQQADLFNAVFVEYRKNFKEDMIALWKVWVPSALINFTMMPMWGRIPFVASTSLIWTCILSIMRGSDEPVSGEATEVMGPHVSGRTWSLIESSLSSLISHSDPVDLDPHLHHLTVSATGPDKIGLVHRLTRAVAEAGGNITTSKMVRLGNQFVFLLHLSYDPDVHSHNEILSNLQSISPQLKVTSTAVHSRTTDQRSTPVSYAIRVTASGQDRPGMIAGLTGALSRVGCNIENLESELRMEDGTKVFHVKVDSHNYRKEYGDHVEDLKDDLESVKGSMGLDQFKVTIFKDTPSQK